MMMMMLILIMGVNMNGLGVYSFASTAAWSYGSGTMASKGSLWIVDSTRWLLMLLKMIVAPVCLFINEMK